MLGKVLKWVGMKLLKEGAAKAVKNCEKVLDQKTKEYEKKGFSHDRAYIEAMNDLGIIDNTEYTNLVKTVK